MSCHTEIEIAATPEEVRRAFLDFEHWHEMKNDVIRSVSRLPSNNGGQIEPGEKLSVNFSGMSECIVTVLENTPEVFRWRGDVLYVLSGEHSFRFQPSTKTPGWTTFINSETFLRANVVLMRLISPKKAFQQLCDDLKAKVEGTVKEAGDKL